MSTATMTSKGQITIPKEIREELNLSAGSKVMFVRLLSGEVRMIARTGSIRDLAGMLYDPDGPRLTIEEMDEAIGAAVMESDLRSRER